MRPRFEIVRYLGEGSSGLVYQARDRETGREVALKKLKSDNYGLFTREFRLLAHVTHPGLVRLLELLPSSGSATLVMEWLNGPNLDALDAKFLRSRIMSIARQLTEAVAVLHAHGIVHADLKPNNVHLLSGDRLVLVDFGFSTAIGTNLPSVGMSPAYAPPEWTFTSPPTPAWDVWGIGAILRQLLTGFPPRFDAPLPPEHPLSELIDGMLAERPEDRPSIRDILRVVSRGERPRLTSNRQLFVGRKDVEANLKDICAKGLKLPQVVILNGAAGVGKTTLMDMLEQNGVFAALEFTVARVRCSAFDQMPFRALDPLVESMSFDDVRYNWQALAQFLPGLGARLDIPLDGSPETRVGALEELIELASKAPRALIVDDAHYADAESAVMLGELLSGLADNGLGAVLIVIQRDPSSPFSEALYTATRAAAVSIDTFELLPLEYESASHIVKGVLGATSRKDSLLKVAEGNPWLLELLCQLPEHVDDEQSLWKELVQLTPFTEAVMVILAVNESFVSLESLTKYVATNVNEVFRAIVHLRELGVVSTRLEDGRPVSYISNDRFRSLIVRRADKKLVVRTHKMLAEELLGSESGRHRRAQHLIAGGELREGRLILKFLARSEAKRNRWLQAARYWDLVKETGALEDNELEDYARCLSQAGRGKVAAELWSQLAQKSVDPSKRQELLLQAAAAWLHAGYGAQGLRYLRRAIAGSNAFVPRTFVGDVLRVSRGMRSDDDKLAYGPPQDLTEADELELNALYSAATGFAMWRPIKSGAAQTEFLHRSLCLGSRSHLLRAICIQLIQRSGHFYDLERSSEIRKILKTLADEQKSDEARFFFETGAAGSAWMEGRVHEHISSSRQAVSMFGSVTMLDAWLRDSVYILYITGLLANGQIGELKVLLRRLRQDARDREDLYFLSNILVHGQWALDLAEERPERAELHLDEAVDPWRANGFNMLEMFAGFQRVRVYLVAGEPLKALAFFEGFLRRMRFSLLLSLASHQAYLAEVYALVVGALLATGEGTQKIRDHHYASALKRLKMSQHPNCIEHQMGLKARLCIVRGDRASAEQLWGQVAEMAQLRGAQLVALAANMYRGHDGDVALRKLGVRSPSAFARALIP